MTDPDAAAPGSVNVPISAFARSESRRGSTLLTVTPIPSDPLKRPPAELTLGDGRKVKLKIPGLAPPPKPGRTEERGSAEPPRDDPRPLINPDHIGP